ncbi:MAG: BTAD domain-containing putative transcriptional regulator [Hespellia sp.]|nr:BTAD domain-containing putative transcriptional regulator [Hespellia sp.]
MGKEKNILEIHTFGSMSIRYQEKPLILSKSMTGKMMYLLITLLYNRKNGIHREELLSSLYEDIDMVQAANSLRALIFRLRKNLVNAGLPKQDYIVYGGNTYRWNSEEIEVSLDSEIFEKLLDRARDTVDSDKKQEYLEQACEVYQGEFLPNMLSDEWVIQINHKLQRRYFEAMRELMRLLKQKKDYRRLLSCCDQIAGLYPYEEWQLAKMSCLIDMKEYEQAMQYYNDITQLYQQEFNAKPPESLSQMRRQLRRYVDEEIYSISRIRGRFIEEEGAGGATYCDTEAFATVYRYLSQVVGRTEIPACLLLITIVNHDHMPLRQPGLLKSVKNSVSHVIRISARSSDLYTRIGRNQFLLLLIDCSVDAGKGVAQRVLQNFSETPSSREIELCYTIDPVETVTQIP